MKVRITGTFNVIDMCTQEGIVINLDDLSVELEQTLSGSERVNNKQVGVVGVELQLEEERSKR